MILRMPLLRTRSGGMSARTARIVGKRRRLLPRLRVLPRLAASRRRRLAGGRPPRQARLRLAPERADQVLGEAAFSLYSPADQSSSAIPTPTLCWNATNDTGSGLDHYQLFVDGSLGRDGIASTCSTPTATLAEGAHTWSVRKQRNETVHQIGSTPPTPKPRSSTSTSRWQTSQRSFTAPSLSFNRATALRHSRDQASHRAAAVRRDVPARAAQTPFL